MADNEIRENDTVLSDSPMEDTKKEDGEEEMEADDSDSDESEDDDDDDDANEQRAEELVKLINDSPYVYNNHVELIKLLKSIGDLDKLREARERMHSIFPLTEELWQQWLKDEISLAGEEDREKIEELFERAVKDYLSIPIWLEYVQYAIGGMGREDGIKRVRDVFEQALTAAGLHVAQGSSLWEAYREFENAILTGLLPEPGCIATKELEEKFSAQHDKVSSVFKRQLTVPLLDMEETYKEYKEWLQDEPDPNTKQTYNKTQAKLEKLKPYENALLAAEPPRLDEYLSYIKYEESLEDPARILCIYERAIQENCLNPQLWLMYTKYLDVHLKSVRSVIMQTYQRAVRNCPWSVHVWQNYLLAMERFEEKHDNIKETFEKALLSGFSLGSEYLQLWTTYLDYLRRKINWKEEHSEDLETFRLTIEKAIEHIDGFGSEGDPNNTVRQFWATIEARYCKNMEKSRELWNEILIQGQANQASVWLEYYRHERAYGDSKHCRRVLQRALNSVTDFPESIVDAYINFEREEGTLDQYDQAVMKCESQMQRVNERREKVAEKEAEAKEQKLHARQEKKMQKKVVKISQQQRSKFTRHKVARDDLEEGGSGAQLPTSKGENVEFQKMVTDEDGFKVPLLPGPPGQKSSAPPPGFKGQGTQSKAPPGYKGGRSAPPPGYKGKIENSESESCNDAKEETEEPPAKKFKTDLSTRQRETDYDRTIFVSNLLYSIDEDRIKEIFSKCGAVSDVRLIRNFKGASKGYAYVEFEDELPVIKALAMDREMVEGRPMYVSRCEDRHKQKAQFKFSTEMEKNKLFVKNLPFTCTKDALEKIFAEHGELKEVRLVTYRSGRPKGLAYVEYKDTAAAAQAVLKTDGLLIGENAISVAISNPPARKTPLEQREESSPFLPTLGGGKKQTEQHGVARTQIQLIPRALKTKAQITAPKATDKNQTTSTSTAKTETDPDSNKSGGAMSNEDFRKMLLNK
ncbi:hypothetical protein CHS0354_003704 [Potamilus streckersoni]|uniref:RRM domain-containing protein n=1 Tax=Potamilus streckersoni TaxID=2493646 RepID=A0AAE0SS99_9BIVA|nr:hypothetical protein CHS0354_003704 [Potamilus streckersoni]